MTVHGEPAAEPPANTRAVRAAPGELSAGIRLRGEPWPVQSPARVYICGITPYDVTHLGHAAVFVWVDALRSVLRLAGVDVVMCRNVTDVDDVLTEAATTRGRQYDEYALTQEFLFDRDMAALGVRRPDHAPHARHHVAQVLEMAAALVAAGHAYVRGGHVFFRGSAVVERAGLDPAEAGRLFAAFGEDPAGDAPDARRDDPFDVPVWRRSPDGEPGWPSPWGRGRPGWHAECAAMARAVLGLGVDVVVGGEDLAFPHHAYQAAMAEAASGVRPFTRRYMHVGSVCQDGEKMAKSTGNLTLVGDLVQHHPAGAIRLMLLDRRWSDSWEYTPEALPAAAAALDRLYAAAGRPASSAHAVGAVTASLLDDLDVPRALAIAEEAGGPAARLLVDVLRLS